jgi:DNA-binding response OmpR family regulator
MSEPSRKVPKVLVVDGDDVLQWKVSRALRDQGIDVVSLLHPWRILEVAEEQRPDLILVDVEMGYHQGNRLEELKQNRVTLGVPIFMHSSKDTRYDRLLAFELGADEYFGKPLQPDAMAERIASRLEKLGWSLSARPPARDPAQTIPDLLEIDRQQVELLRAAEEEREVAAASRPSPVAASTQRPVLIVEDDNDIRNSLSHILEDEGIPTLTARNGKEALDILKLEHTAPSLVLLDLMMPVMDGWEFRRRIETDRLVPPPKVVIVSAMSPDRTIGAAAWLRKPLGVEQLLSTVTRLASP